MDLLPASSAAPADVGALLDLCFGPARQRRTAALLRQGAPRIGEASFVARDGGALVGSVDVHRLEWRHPAARRPIALLGPLVSHPERRNEGIGSLLMEQALAAIDRLGLPVFLIGDAPYYGRWGFSADHTRGWLLPGPVERERLLLRWRAPAEFDGPGLLSPPGMLPSAGVRDAA